MPGHAGTRSGTSSGTSSGHALEGQYGTLHNRTTGHRDNRTSRQYRTLDNRNTGHGQHTRTPELPTLTPAFALTPPAHTAHRPPPTAHSSWPPMRMRITGARYAHAHRPAVRRFWGRALSFCCFFSLLSLSPPRFSFCGGIFALRCAAGADLQRPFLRAAVRCPRC